MQGVFRHAISIAASVMLAVPTGSFFFRTMAKEEVPARSRFDSGLPRSLERRNEVLLAGHRRPILGTGISADGQTLVTCSWDRTVSVWDAASGRELARYEVADTGMFPLCVAADATIRQVVTAGPAGSDTQFGPGPGRNPTTRWGSVAKIWDARSGRLIRSLTLGGRSLPLGVASTRDGTRVACVDRGFSAKLWDVATGRVISSVDGRPGDTTAILDPPHHGWAFSEDATRFSALARGEGDHPDAIYVCDLTGLIRTRSEICAPVWAEPHHSRLNRSRRAQVSSLFRIRSGPIPLPIEGGGRYWAVTLRGDGTEVAAWVCGGDATVLLCVFDFGTGRLKRRLPTPGFSDVSYLAFSPDGHVLLLGSREGRVYFCDSGAGTPLAENDAGDGPVRSVAFMPDRLRVLYGYGSTTGRPGSSPTATVAEPLVLTDLRARQTR
jgi:WD40 repeat protein